jgi:hypothetical protein
MFLALETDGTTIKTPKHITLCLLLDGSQKIIKTRNSSKELLANVLTQP